MFPFELKSTEMAKIVSIFATKFFDKVPDESKEKECSKFKDLRKTNSELQWYIIEACELWYMWYESDGINYLKNFRPTDKLTRAEVATIFSRIIWWNTYAWDSKHWYEWHLNAMNEAGIINDVTEPNSVEIRWNVFLMLNRVLWQDVTEDDL